MLVLHDKDLLTHRTVELLGAKIIPALESPERIIRILDALQNSQHDVQQLSMQCYDTDEERLLQLNAILSSHDPGYIEHLKTAHDAWVAAEFITADESILPECFHFRSRAEFQDHAPVKPKDIYALAGYYAFDMSTGIMKETFNAALASAHLALSGVDVLGQVASQEVKVDKSLPQTRAIPVPALTNAKVLQLSEGTNDVLALCRPPGHHCDTKQAGGYCYINNAVVAVERWLTSHPGHNIGILDIDFHHGNGTQEYFYSRSDVLYVSIHGKDEYPYYTGAEHETGIGEGEGYNFNLPLASKSSVEAYIGKLSVALARLEMFKPDFLVVSLGFDTYRLDPLGGFEIDKDDYVGIAFQIREHLKVMPALILLEGGYVLDDLGKNLLAFLSGWEAAT